ncbi:MAG: type II secretory pathway component PulF [Oceanospirillaceae bacterium]|jgi:type II secretory pathway component PulF
MWFSWHWQHVWLWYGLDAKHVESSGVRRCSSRQMLRAQLALEGVQLNKAQYLWPWQRHWPKRIDQQNLQTLLEQWAQLLCAGLPLLSCISLVHLEQASGRLRYELIQLQSALLTGANFSQALSQSRMFPPTIVQLVQAGEASGELGELLTQIHQQSARQENLKRRFKHSLFMPLVTLLSGWAVSLLIIYWVVPQVANLYASDAYELPILTQWLLDFSHMANSNMGSVLVAFMLGYITLVWLWSVPKARVKLEWLLWHVPGLGRLMYLQSQAEVFLVLSLTFRTGVPLLDCLTLAANGSSWKRVSKDLKMAMVGLQQGQKLSQILTKMAWQPQALQLIRVGEASGNLALSFTQLQGYYEAQVVNQSKWLEQLLEPVLLIVVAVFVGLILVALYLPLFQVGQMM